MEDLKTPTAVTEPKTASSSDDVESTEVLAGIYVDPEKEKAALRKFDKWLVPTAFVFMVLSSMDRNNVSWKL